MSVAVTTEDIEDSKLIIEAWFLTSDILLHDTIKLEISKMYGNSPLVVNKKRKLVAVINKRDGDNIKTNIQA